MSTNGKTKIPEEVLKQINVNNQLISSAKERLTTLKQMVALEDEINLTNTKSNELIIPLLKKEGKTIYDIQGIDFQAGEITFKEVEDANKSNESSN